MSDSSSPVEPNFRRPTLTHEMVLELLPAYILAALEPDEMLAVQDYLDAHPELHARLTELEATVDLLALAPEEVEPPAHVKQALMAWVVADAQYAASAKQEQLPSDSISYVATAPTQSEGPRIHEQSGQEKQPLLASWQSRLRNLFGPTLAAATVLILLVAVIYGAFSWNQARRLAQDIAQARQEIAQLQRQVDELQQINQRLEQELIDSRRQIALFTAPDRVVLLAGTSEAPEAQGAFYISNNEGMLVLRHLPSLPPEKIYELWLIPADGSPVPAGLIQPQEAGVQTVRISLENQLTDFAAVGLSIEPAGGSPSPTGPIILLGEAG